MSKYIKKPLIVEAYQTDKELDIDTLEGTMHASVGDYIITGINGEQYPCKPDIFHKTYSEYDGEYSKEISFVKWNSVYDKLPAKAGEYLVVYHPCWWDDVVDENITQIGLDSFRGKTTWAKHKFQYVTHWAELPSPPTT